MGEVYRAGDVVLERDVAAKILTLRDPAMLRRFERKAEAIGKLDNHNVVEIHDCWLVRNYPLHRDGESAGREPRRPA